MTKRFFAILAIFSSLSFHLLAQQGGSSVYGFLHLPNSARVGSLGGNQVGLADGDLNLWYHNPGTLAMTEGTRQLVLNVVPYLSDINYGFVGYSQSVEKVGTLAIGIHNINYGSFDMVDEYDQGMGTFHAREYAILLGFARKLTPNFTAGITFKPVISQFESYRSFGLAADMGANFITNDGLFNAGIVLKNFGSQISNYNGDNEKMPTDLQVGFSQKLAHAPFRFLLTFQGLMNWDLDYQIDESQNGSAYDTSEDDNIGLGDNILRHTVIGVEFLPSKSFNVNMGYNHRRRQELKIEEKGSTVGFSWGFGLKLYKFRFAYGSARYHLAGSSNHFSLTTNFSDWGR
ncbi:MAG: type IX secretion system protein PorQ [Breznakibacter sp.]